MRKHETLTEVESSHGTLYSAKLCKYTHFTTRSVSKSNILKLNFVNYCTVQDPARNVLQLLYYNFFSSYHYNEDTFFSFFKMSLDSHFNCPDDVKAAFFCCCCLEVGFIYILHEQEECRTDTRGIGTRR